MTPGLKIISGATGVVELCTDVSTGGWGGRWVGVGDGRWGCGGVRQHLFIVHNSLHQTHCNQCFCRSFYLSHHFLSMAASPGPPSEQCWLLIISKWSQLRVLQIQKPFGRLEPFGLTVHNRPHVPPSARRYCSTKAAPPALFSKMYFISLPLAAYVCKT